MKSLKSPFFLHVILFCCLGLWFNLMLGSCKAFHPSIVPVNTETIYNVKDTIIYHDSTVITPVETYYNVAWNYDTLIMETSLAKAECWVDSIWLRGSLTNKQSIIYKYINNTETIYKDSIVNVEVPVYVERTQRIKNPLNTFSISLNIILISLAALAIALWFYKKKYSLFNK